MAAYVQLRVAAETYAIPVEHALEVAELGELVVVPGARAELLGVRNLRGRILPVVDLAGLLGASRTEPAGKLLVTEADGEQAGLAIDDVSGVGELPEPTEDTASPLLRGAVLRDGELIGVLDVPALFRALAATAPAGGTAGRTTRGTQA